ncbi:MAG: polysaccharide biosynthesis C-terminal domain-containing protein [Saprospiraceae bacterium]|nr:polysaccharide biosynthesis C-terminal domain-containing protein [Saprospiraceae bacterium]
MKREFTINLFLLLVINFLIKPAYIFGIDARIQNLVGTENYGMYFYYLNFVFLFQFINDPGIQNWNAQFVPKNRGTISSHLSNLLCSKLILSLLFISFTLVFAWIVGYADLTMIFLLCINAVLSSLFLILRGTIAGLGYYRIDSWLSILDKCLMIIILGYFAWISSYKENFDISMFIYGQGIAYFLCCIVGMFILKNHIYWVLSSFSKQYFFSVLKQSAPYVLILIFMTTYNKLDGVMLGYMLDDHHHQAGVYASAYRFYEAANMIGYLFAALLLPMFAANVFDKKILEELKTTALRFVLLSSLIIVLIIFFYGEAMLKWLYTNYEPGFLSTLKVLILSYLMVSVAYIFGTMLVAAGKVKNLNFLFGAGLLINIALNLLLIPSYKALGAGVATLITQTFVMIGQIFLVSKELKIYISGDDLIKPLLFAIMSIAIFYFVSQVISGQWVINLTISILICLLLSFILKIIDKKEILNLLKKEN